ncbi:NAD(P)/FAD-dependent oxidoreductase [Cumulibacter manganitolerans]|uniref:NAD(P)/FAD-dependent oxidoreductase n=1 Tax=Cumulibacter manganitolerans TaxID=1884992 RepID=UPI0012963CD0|nr:FAD-dependent oxidoreductase [Cumulibacter manganitolerans]
MSTPRHVAIVGGGLAGAKTAEALRDQGFTGQVSLLAAESHPPYERPPLSKDYLAGGAAFDDAIVHPLSWYRDNDVDLQLGARATGVDAAAHRLHRADGSALDYDKLVLATGSVPRRLPLPGADAAGVLTLRTREDADAIRAHFGDGKHLVVIGGGWIGLEVAATARGAGTAVTVLEAAELPLIGVVGPELAPVFAALHRDHGVDLLLGAQVAAITTEDGAATGVRLADGTVIASDAVVVGVGVAPDLAVAESAGLAIDNGVLVDASLRSSDPDIYAVGDIANHDHPVLGHRVRVEHWATALNQPASAVAALLGQDTVYRELPFFYSDQYDLGLEYIGHAPPGSHDRLVVHGDLEAREFVAFWLREERILAAMNVNVWDVVDKVKPLITNRTRVDPQRLEKLGPDA